MSAGSDGSRPISPSTWRTDLVELNRKLTDFTGAVSSALDGHGWTDAVFTLLGAAEAIGGAAAGPTPGALLGAAEGGRDLLHRIGRMWTARRFAAITAPLRVRKSLAGLHPDITRLFGHGMDNEEMTLLAAARKGPWT